MARFFALKSLLLTLILLTASSFAFSTGVRDPEETYSTYESIDFKKETPPEFAIFEKALKGYNLLLDQITVSKPLLTIIDFTKSANEKRMWVIDLEKKKLLYHCLTAHGRNSGDVFANSFSNVPNSNKSSLGFYVTGSTYIGKHGTSLILKGIEPEINDQAEARRIVMHGADYVSEEFISKHGRLGRSLGCPAVPVGLHKEIIKTIANGSCLYIYHPSHQQNLISKAKT